jgi:hypothetical protein
MQCMEGSDIGSLDSQTGVLVSLFNPRRHRWSDHFVFRGAVIEPLTAEGNATARLLKLNIDKRVLSASCWRQPDATHNRQRDHEIST